MIAHQLSASATAELHHLTEGGAVTGLDLARHSLRRALGLLSLLGSGADRCEFYDDNWLEPADVAAVSSAAADDIRRAQIALKDLERWLAAIPTAADPGREGEA